MHRDVGRSVTPELKLKLSRFELGLASRSTIPAGLPVKNRHNYLDELQGLTVLRFVPG